MTSDRVARIVLLLVVMFAVGWCAVISREPGVLGSDMWPVALGAATVVLTPRRYVGPVAAVVGAIGTSTFVLGGRPVGFSLLAGVGIAVEVLVIWAILTRRGTAPPRILDILDLSRYQVAAALAGLTGGVLLGLAAWVTHAPHPALVGIGTFVGHCSSVLVLMPFFMQQSRQVPVAPRVERWFQWTTLVSLTAVVFLIPHLPGLAVTVIPVLAWAALRMSMVVTQVQLILVATISTLATAFGFGPLAQQQSGFAVPGFQGGAILQIFLIACALTVVPLALVVGRQREAVAEAQHERDLADSIVDSVHVAIIVTDDVGRITRFNPGACQLLGYEERELLGKSTRIFHTPEEVTRVAGELGVPDDFDEVALALAISGRTADNMVFLHRDGSERILSLSLVPLHDARGRITGFIATAEDVTARQRAHEALVEALDKERTAVERLQEVDRVKDAFVSSVSHELRTPITSISGYLEMLSDGEFGELNGEQHRAIDRVGSNSRRLLTLIDELLTLSRMQSTELAPSLARLDLRGVVGEAFDLARPSFEAHAQRAMLHVPDQPVMLLADDEMLGRLAGNLISNASKFTPRGGRIDVTLAAADHQVTLTVSDTGIGIPREEQERLFTRFFRASTAQTNAIPGTGLGLAISQRAVEMHGGRIRIESETGQGTTVVVELPLDATPDKEPERDAGTAGAAQVRSHLG